MVNISLASETNPLELMLAITWKKFQSGLKFSPGWKFQPSRTGLKNNKIKSPEKAHVIGLELLERELGHAW